MRGTVLGHARKAAPVITDHSGAAFLLLRDRGRGARRSLLPDCRTAALGAGPARPEPGPWALGLGLGLGLGLERSLGLGVAQTKVLVGSGLPYQSSMSRAAMEMP